MAPPKQRMCRLFMDIGECMDLNCKFSHDQKKPQFHNSLSDVDSLYRDWRKLLYNKSPLQMSKPFLHKLPADPMEKFLKGGLEILEMGTPEAVQQFIEDIGSRQGLHRISQLVEADFVSESSQAHLSFKRHCVPFLKIIAHKEMRSSLVLEKDVEGIFGFIYGPEGHQGIRFFMRVAESLSFPSEAEDQESFGSVLLAVGLALSKTLSLNQGVGVRGELRKVVDILTTLVSRVEPKGPHNHTFRSIQGELRRIEVLLQKLDTAPNSEPLDEKITQDIPKGKDQLQVDFPGDRSCEGPRHDNDHADISKIRILPTSEEINSHRKEFIPQRSKQYPYHLEGMPRVLDFQFRLLREDTSGQIREAVRTVRNSWINLMEKEFQGGKRVTKRIMRDIGLQTVIHKNARIEKFDYSRRNGLVFKFSFDQPPKVALLDLDHRIEFWNRSKHLRSDSLLCLMDGSGRSTFLAVNVSNKARRHGGSQEVYLREDIQDLTRDPERAVVMLRFAGTVSEIEIENICVKMASPNKSQVFVEFFNLLPASFEPFLKCLQRVSKEGNIPFPEWLAPSDEHEYSSDLDSEYVHVPPPPYMMKPGMALDLKSITGGEPLKFSIMEDFLTADLQRATTLDTGQCEALVASLSRELALIQGPPGTGKSYIGVQIVKVLLDNREATKIGPIICVCQTNHALDQFLEHLLEDDVTGIIRLGSRSKSEAVIPLALHYVAGCTILEDYRGWASRKRLADIGRDIQEACKQLRGSHNPTALKEFLEASYPRASAGLFDVFNGEDEDKWNQYTNKSQGQPPGPQQIVDDWVSGHGFFATSSDVCPDDRPIEELLTTSVLEMSCVERKRILKYWHDKMEELARSKLLQGAEAHATERHIVRRLDWERMRRRLLRSHIIGATTSGFASHADLIRSVNPKVLICEEAAEVLEAHTLSFLIPGIEQTILIGDHLQLRPQVLNHCFSMENPRGGKDYGLDMSFLERAAGSESYNGKKFPISRLDTQRRMHPSISNLVRSTLYPNLRDYDSAKDHPCVPGMGRRLFWMDHREPESGFGWSGTLSTSYENEWESNLCVNLVRHLWRQGVYKSGEIVVLSPYLKQISVLRRKLASVLEVSVRLPEQEQLGEIMEDYPRTEPAAELAAEPTHLFDQSTLLDLVRVATVDDFQGEEAKVVVISLVRSNKKNRCGFLKSSNRINVMLSRARDGMYIIGNAATCHRVEMWSKVIGMLEKDGNFGKQLELCCPQHHDKPIFINQPEDFDELSPEGGCEEPCEWPHNCGHPCIGKCHSDVLHQSTVCLEPCKRSFKHCNHSCSKPCGMACGECEKQVPGVVLPCGHSPNSLFCGQLQDLSRVKCKEIIQQPLSICGHGTSIECWKSPLSYVHARIRGGNLRCGHQCRSGCKECTRTQVDDEKTATITVRNVCEEQCGKKYKNCSHSCSAYCHDGEPCPPCVQPCEVQCSHSKCQKACGEPCTPCAEKCSWACDHRGRCEMPCAVPCNINPCSERCGKLLECGHLCPSVCGERCPSEEFCQICGHDETLKRVVDLIMLRPYADIDANTDPIIVPTCGHFYTMKTYDSIMGMESVYNIDGLGRIRGPKVSDGTGNDCEVEDNDKTVNRSDTINCPDCRAPLTDIHRYNRLVKMAHLDESSRRFCTNVQKDYLNLYRKVSDRQDLLQESRDELLARLRAIPKEQVSNIRIPQFFRTRIRKAQKLLDKIQHFIAAVDKEEKPYSEVRHMAISGQAKQTCHDAFVADYSVMQTGFRLKSQNLFLAFKCGLLWDWQAIAESLTMDKVTTMNFRRKILKNSRQSQRQCSQTIEACLATRFENYEVEARIYHAQFFALARLQFNVLKQSQDYKYHLPTAADFDQETELAEIKSLDRCQVVCDRLPGTVGPLKNKIEQTRRLFAGGSYHTISEEEKGIAHYAVSTEFSPTRCWYICENGHPFTTSKYGATRQMVRCPYCGAMRGGLRGVALMRQILLNWIRNMEKRDPAVRREKG